MSINNSKKNAPGQSEHSVLTKTAGVNCDSQGSGWHQTVTNVPQGGMTFFTSWNTRSSKRKQVLSPNSALKSAHTFLLFVQISIHGQTRPIVAEKKKYYAVFFSANNVWRGYPLDSTGRSFCLFPVQTDLSIGVVCSQRTSCAYLCAVLSRTQTGKINCTSSCDING